MEILEETEASLPIAKRAVLGLGLLAIGFIAGGVAGSVWADNERRVWELISPAIALSILAAIAAVIPHWISRGASAVVAWILVVYLFPYWAMGFVFAIIAVAQDPLLLLPAVGVTIPFVIAIAAAKQLTRYAFRR